jgi:hypothetical protein
MDGKASGNYSMRVGNGTKKLQLLMQCCPLVLSRNHELLFLSLSFLSPLSFSSNQLCKALRLFKREGDELSNRYDLLLASHMTASVSSQQNTIQTLPQLTKLPFGNSESIFILNKCFKKSKRK